MFGGTQEQQLQPTTQAPITAEEEALKRNTDCVYFLASPLTCKKGSECEYRHSDIARVNPRDCWYWMNGNCLNPKCGFRHPPLDGLLGTQVPTPLGASLPPSQTVAAPSSLAPYVTGKQAVPCIYFQKGNCLKGGICPFTHAPFPVSNKVAQFAAITPVTESQSNEKTFGGLEKCSQEQKISHINVPKSVELPLQAKELTRIQMYQLSNGVVRKNVPLPTSLKDECSRYMAAKVHSSSNWNSVSRENRNHQVHVPDNQSILNGKEAEEISREPSPGFDVLVDDELRDSDYYPSEDQFGKTRGREGRNLNPTNDYEIGRSDYNSMTDADRNTYHESRGYESNERLQGHYGWEEHRASSDRMIGGSAHLERRRYPKADSADEIDESDLRHHLSKQKRGNGLRSVISHDHTRENHVADRSFWVSRRDHLPAQESSISSRLRGRIKIPGRSTSPVNKNDTWSEREIERGRHRGKSSPERPQGRLRDRMKERVHEDLNNEERNFRGPQIRRDIDDRNAEFTGPKKLAELKVGKKSESYNQHISDRLSLGKRKYPKLDGAPQQVEGDMSFEGPKPLSEILKRKRGGEIAVYESGMTSVNNEDNDQTKGKESFMMPIGTKETKGVFSSMSSDELNRVHRNKEDSKPAAGDIGETEEKIKSTEIEEGMIADEAMEDQEAEGYDQREGEYDYEQADGEDYNLDEGENLDPEEECYEEEDDADDFAKKMGVMYS